MAYLCLDCFEVYDILLKYCPKKSCQGKMVEVDELMLPTIILLNQKGYITEYCCSGHINDCYPYILFDNYINRMFSENYLKELFKDIPEPWYIDDTDSLHRVALRCDLKNDNISIVELQKFICDINIKLLEFVNALPSLMDDDI